MELFQDLLHAGQADVQADRLEPAVDEGSALSWVWSTPGSASSLAPREVPASRTEVRPFPASRSGTSIPLRKSSPKGWGTKRVDSGQSGERTEASSSTREAARASTSSCRRAIDMAGRLPRAW